MKRPLIFTFFGILSLVAGVGIAGTLWAWTNLPSIDTTIEVPAIEAPVDVMRDQAGIPHIFAKSSRDAYFALGFVHAQDRFWQMEMMRRYAAGRLAEVLGPEAVASDKWMRTLGLYRLVEEQFDGLSEPVREALNFYAAGVNARIERAKSLPWGVAAPEFALLGYSPEPWRPADSLIWGKVMAHRLGGNWRDEILRARLARKLTPQQVGELWPLYPADAPATIETVAALTRGMELGRLAAAPPRPFGLPRGASNAWVVNRRNSTNRGPILANDPHLGFAAPILWYLARIKAPDLDVTGATVPGVPFTILGHNGRIAWGMTNTQSDIQDLFVEQTNVDGTRYRTPEGFKDFVTRTETIAVKGAKPIKIKIRQSRHGPIISDVNEDSAKTAGKGAVIALRATFLEPGDGTVEAFYRLNRAENWAAFVDALKGFQGPQTNFLFADTKGDIGFLAPGLVPIRKSGWGLVPSPGWDGATDWTGFVPFDQLPSLLNPPAGVIVNANNRVTPEDYPYFITHDWAPGYRARRILELLAKKRLSMHGAAKIQKDNVSLMALQLLPLMLDIEPDDEAGRNAVALLGKWDGAMARGLPEPLIFSTWLLELNRAIYADELGDLFDRFLTLRPRFIVSVLTRRQAWCDDVNTPGTEDCQSRLLLALKQAMKSLETSFGPDFREWRWGDVHRARFVNHVLGAVPGLGRFVNLDIPTDGGNYTVNRGASHVNNPGRPFEHVHGPGFRAIYDLENLRRSQFSIATGQSGNPLSSHYGDQLAGWRDGRYKRLGQARSALKNSAEAILVLTPMARGR